MVVLNMSGYSKPMLNNEGIDVRSNLKRPPWLTTIALSLARHWT